MNTQGFFANNLTAHAGGGQNQAPIYPGQYNSIYTTVATDADSCTLPTNVLPFGQTYWITNFGTHFLDVFPPTGGTILAGALNGALAVLPNQSLSFIATSAVNYTATNFNSPIFSQATAITAASATTAPNLGAQVLATPIGTAHYLTNVNVAASTLSTVSLPVISVVGIPYTIYNNTAFPIAVFPDNVGGAATINGLGNVVDDCYVVIGSDASAIFTTIVVVGSVSIWVMSGYAGPKAVIPLTNVSRVVNAGEADCIFSIIAGANNRTIFLPSVALSNGMTFTFYMGGNAGTNTYTVAAATAVAQMNVSNSDMVVQTAPFVANRTNLVFSTAATIGDKCIWVSDGIDWYVQAYARAHDHFTQS